HPEIYTLSLHDALPIFTVSRKFDEAVRVSYSRTEEVAHASQVEHPLVRESLALLGIEGGIEITSVADIPARGTGLGSSSSFTVRSEEHTSELQSRGHLV